MNVNTLFGAFEAMSADPSVDLNAIRQIVRFLGTPSVAYLLNIPDAHVRAFLEGTTTFDPTFINALQLLRPSIENARHFVPRNNDLSEHGYWFLRAMQMPDGGHLFTRIRQTFAPSESMQPSDDAVFDALVEIAKEAFPFLLLPKREGVWAPSMASGFFLPFQSSTPLGRRFTDAVCADADLSLLFPEVRQNVLETISTITCSNGFGQSMQLVGLADNLLHVAFAWMRMRNGSLFSDFTGAMQTLLSKVRALARGETALIPTVVCFHGVALPAGMRRQIKLGELCAISEGLHDLIPPPSRPPMGAAENVLFGFVLVTEVELSIKISAGVILSAPMTADFQRFTDAITRKVEIVSLATSLAVERRPPVAVVHKTSLTLNPFSYGSYSWSASSYQTPSAPTVLTDVEWIAMGTWCDTIAVAKDEPARIAVKRALRAMSGREQAVDSFVDAIIALESLFGDRDQIALSVAACVSKLVETDLDRRKSLFRETKKLYGRRSAILHGAELPLDVEVRELRDRALVLLLECFRILYRDRPELLNMSAAVRDMQILLQT
jgi:hypothetical protein